MNKKFWKALGFMCLAAGASNAEDMGSMRVTTVVSSIEGGGTTTNQINYNERGLVSGYVITTDAPVVGTMIITVEFSFDNLNQITRLQTDMQSSFGSEQWDFTYNYDGSDPPLLISVEGSNNIGTTATKLFTYDEDRVIGLNSSVVTPDGQTASDIHVLTYDANGRIVSNARTYTNSEGTAPGGYDIEFGPDGAPIGYTQSEPFGGVTEAQITRTQLGITEESTTVFPDGSSVGAQTVSQFQPGPCRIPKLTDGYTIETIFDTPNGFFPADGCRE